MVRLINYLPSVKSKKYIKWIKKSAVLHNYKFELKSDLVN